MAVCYNKLFHMMIDQNITMTELKKATGFSANIVGRIKKNEYISMESLERICKALSCGVDDILEFQTGNRGVKAHD